MSSNTGRFVWFDLMTNDIQGAKSFYSDVIGWGTTQWPGSDYQTWTVGGQTVGGLMSLPGDGKPSSPPSWLGYVSTDNVDSTVKRAQTLGGKVLAPGTDIPEVGRYAVLADPQDAVFAIFQALPRQNPPSDATQKAFSWAELHTTDWKAAWKFYSELVGWKHTSSMDMGPQYGEYFMFGLDSKQSLGGMSNTAAAMKTPSHWLHYISVNKVDETAPRIGAKGGKVLNGPMDVPGGGRIAQCMDPQGALFAIHSAS